LTAIPKAPPAVPARPAPSVAGVRKRDERRRRFRRDRALLIMTAPAVLLLVVFNYVPMFGTATAFQSYSIYAGFMHSP
jgi:putative aldouronate transport system permease protein